MRDLVPIFDDLFDIADRLKGIDSDYFVMYNRVSHRYELHNSRYRESLQMVLPYDCLDSRTIAHVYRTLPRNCENLLTEIEAHNNALDKQKIGTILDKARYKTNELVKYLGSGGTQLPSYEGI